MYFIIIHRTISQQNKSKRLVVLGVRRNGALWATVPYAVLAIVSKSGEEESLLPTTTPPSPRTVAT